MNAKLQYNLSAADLAVVLALVRFGNLALAGERLGIDASTVFRSIQKIEKGLGQALFERSRTGYLALDLALELARYAELIETQMEAARFASMASPHQVSGTVRITSTDSILHGLVAPALKSLKVKHPLLTFDVHAGSELLSLTRRDADIAVRATKRPPAHLVGKCLGPIRVAVYAAKKSNLQEFNAELALQQQWIAPDEALPDHPSVIWRKKHFPKIGPVYRVNSIVTVAELIAAQLGIGVLPTFLGESRKDLVAISEVIDECQTDLWLLSHADSRHFRRVSAVYAHFSEHIQLV
jgi:DNA-binding transcriptional LysR family regulator